MARKEERRRLRGRATRPPGQGITIGMYFNPTLSLATSRALIQTDNQLIRHAGGIQGVKMGLFFGVVNAFQWYANSWK